MNNEQFEQGDDRELSEEQAKRIVESLEEVLREQKQGALMRTKKAEDTEEDCTVFKWNSKSWLLFCNGAGWVLAFLVFLFTSNTPKTVFSYLLPYLITGPVIAQMDGTERKERRNG